MNGRLLTPSAPVHITVDDSVLKRLSDALHNMQVTVDVSPSTLNLCYFAMCALIALTLGRLFRK
jgi:hypothetical protein